MTDLPEVERLRASVDFFAQRFVATATALGRVRTLIDEAERGEGIVITPGFTTYYAVDAGLLRDALDGDHDG